MALETQQPATHQLIPVERNDRMRQAAEVLLTARRECKPIDNLAPELRPQTLDEAYALQDVMAQAFGALGTSGREQIGGWKIGAASAEATPRFAPMPLVGGFMTTGSTLAAGYSRLRGVEAEIAFLLGRDLPARAQAYTVDEVRAAIASAHPAIEILESAFIHPDAADPLSVTGDMQIHGGFVHGPAVQDWQAIDFAAESVEVLMDGAVRFDGRSSNTAGHDLVRLVTWLANEGQYRTGGLHAGQWITTGSGSGKAYGFPGTLVEVRFRNMGAVGMRFAPVD